MSTPSPEPERIEERLLSGDGLSLHCRAWLPAHPRGVAVLVHGLAEHTGRYDWTGTELARHGWACWGADLRGHGLSEGLPGHVDGFEGYLADLAAVRSRAAERCGPLPQVLLGHSQGSLVALLEALERPAGLDALVLSSPLLALHPSLRLPAPLHRLALAASRVVPRLRVPSRVNPDHLSRDPAVVAAYRGDPLVSRRLSLGWYASLHRALEEAWRRAPGLQPRTLVAYAVADRLVDPQAPPRLAAAAPRGRVTLRPHPHLYHELLNEPERAVVLAEVCDWLG